MELPVSRLDSLYKDFRPLKELNPDGYSANVDTWRVYLTFHYLRDSKSMIFHCGSELLRKLNREPYGPPKSIDVVINSLVKQGYLITIDDFCNGSTHPRESHKLLKWIGFSLKTNREFESRKNEDMLYLKEMKLVIKSIVESKFKKIYAEITKNIIAHATGITDLIFHSNEFFEKSGLVTYLGNSIEEQELMMVYLSRHKKILLRDGDIVKIMAPSVSHVLKSFPKEITANDRRVAALKESIFNLDQQMKKIENEISDCSLMLKESISCSKPREIQKEYLQGKKLGEKYLCRLLNHHNKLITIKKQLDMAGTNAMLVSTLNHSNELMKSINKSIGSIDDLHELLDEIKQQNVQSEQISDLLMNNADIEHDDDELNMELEQMEREELSNKVKEEAKGKNVPSQDESNADLLRKLSHLKIEESWQQDEAEAQNIPGERYLEKQPIVEM